MLHRLTVWDCHITHHNLHISGGLRLTQSIRTDKKHRYAPPYCLLNETSSLHVTHFSRNEVNSYQSTLIRTSQRHTIWTMQHCHPLHNMGKDMGLTQRIPTDKRVLASKRSQHGQYHIITISITGEDVANSGGFQLIRECIRASILEPVN